MTSSHCGETPFRGEWIAPVSRSPTDLVMSDLIKHECGIAMVRLLKPLSYYEEKYGTPLYGFHKLFLLMEKQHNRGQDGAGIGCVKLQTPRVEAYMFRARET